jgi:hypothetical protein
MNYENNEAAYLVKRVVDSLIYVVTPLHRENFPILLVNIAKEFQYLHSLMVSFLGAFFV